MKTFSIDSDDNIGVFASVEAAGAVPGVERFDSLDQFRGLAEQWPASRLVEIWNGLAGVKPVKKFTDRKTAVSRIWKTLQQLGPAQEEAPEPKAGDRTKSRQLRHTGHKNTKTARVDVLQMAGVGGW
jgi:hypothetical protein